MEDELKASGKARPIMLFEMGEMWIPENFSMNCHECGKTFCPVDATLVATNRISYIRHQFVRMFDILEIRSDFICDHLKKSENIAMYDNPDLLVGNTRQKKEE